MYLLGPVLICLALGIIACLSYNHYYVTIPLYRDAYRIIYNVKDVDNINNDNESNNDSSVPSFLVGWHVFLTCYLAGNVLFHYFMCVTTKSIHVNNPYHEEAVRQLAIGTNYDYPETQADKELRQREFASRVRARRARIMEEEHSFHGGSRPAVAVAAAWMYLHPTEWGWCGRTNLPKPPRSHFDYVTGGLVLNMDHYCPWMFNCVGYLNYRHFVSFLLFVVFAMIYVFSMNIGPFYKGSSEDYRIQNNSNKDNFGVDTISYAHLIPFVPTQRDRSSIGFNVMMSSAVGISVGMLLVFHMYLIFTAQTTIEFNSGRWRNTNVPSSSRKESQRASPYDLGFKRNLKQVFGDCNILISIFLPSTRLPHFLPVPLEGERGHAYLDISDSDTPRRICSSCCISSKSIKFEEEKAPTAIITGSSAEEETSLV